MKNIAAMITKHKFPRVICSVCGKEVSGHHCGQAGWYLFPRRHHDWQGQDCPGQLDPAIELASRCPGDGTYLVQRIPVRLRRAPSDHCADYLIEGMPRLSIQKSNHLNGQYISSQVWILNYTHDDGSTSGAGTFCYLRDIRSLVSSGEMAAWLQGKGFKI